MKVVHLSSHDEIGGRFNGFDAHDALARQGVDSRLLSFWSKSSQVEWADRIVKGQWAEIRAQFVRNVEISTGMQARLQWWTPRLLRHNWIERADVVHLQVINDHWLRLESLLKLSHRKPLVWTWHDLWPLTGHCIFPGPCNRFGVGCGRCPDLSAPLAVNRDRTSREVKRKLSLYGEISADIHISTQWMKDQIDRFDIPSGIRFHQFPFGIDLANFYPLSKIEARVRLGISINSFVVVARATSDPRKNLGALLTALDVVARRHDVTLVCCQETTLPEFRNRRFPIFAFPWSSDARFMRSLMGVADLFAMPSESESFGMMALEAMACGRPVLSPSATAQAEVAGADGLTYEPSSLEALVEALHNAVDSRELLPSIGAAMRRRSERFFSMERYVANLTGLYRHALETYESQNQ